ncbi:MAG: FG-GAP-like repeat-containing protein [Planctomycetota bacterium]
MGTGELQVVQAGARAAEPLVAWVNDGQNPLAGVSVTFEVVQGTGLLEPPGGGERSSSVTVPTDLTGHARAHFVAADTAEAARVEARVDGSSGLPASFQIRSVVPDQLGTRLSGFVRDNSLEGLGGATVRLRFADGAEVQTSTDIAGHFGFTSLQTSGPGLVIVEGSTAVTRGGEPIDPTEVVFPQLAQEAFVVSAAGNVLPRPILLPPLDPETFVLYDGTRDVELTVPEIEGLAVSVPRGTVVTKPDGSIVSTSNPIELSISPVHVDDIPMPLPDGARAPFAWTLQPGGTTFDPPVGITLPNMAGLPPGALAYILVFDHHTNRFEIVAPGQVSADGALIASNPGTGIAEAGWGGFCPPYPATGTVSGPAAPSPGDCSVENLLAKKALLTLVIRGMQLVEPPAYGADHLQHFLDGVGTPLSYGEGDAAVRDIKAHPGFICEHEKIVDELCQKIFSAGGPVSDYSTSTDTIVFYDITSPCGAVDRCFGVKQPAWAFGRIDPASVLIHDVTVDSENNTFSAVATYQMVEHYTFDGDPCEGSAFDAAAQVLEDCNFAQPFDINVAFDVPIEDRPLSCSGSIASEGLNDGGPTNTTLPYVQANTLLNIGGQSAIGEEDGSFEIPNVLADGSIVRVTAVREIAGVTWTGQSEYFQVVDGGSVEVEPFPLVPFALPETVEILATANPPTLTSIGQTATVDTLAALSDGSAIPVAGFSNGVAYQSSQPNIISVDADGVATAQSAGPAFITVTKDGAASTVKIVVAPGDPLTTLQGVVVDAALQPVDGATVTTTGGFETTSQPDGTFQIVGHTTARNPVRVNAGSGDAFGFILELPLAVGGVTEAGTLVIDVDTDGDRLPDWYEINIFNTDRLVADTDGDGLSDGREVLQLGTSPSRADTDGDGFDDSLEATVGSNPLSFDPGTTLTGEVELPGGIPASGAQMNVLGIPSALFSATADGLGAFTFSNPWPAGVSPVTLRGTLSVEGQGFFSGLSEPTPTVPRGTTDMKTLVLTSDVGGPLYPGRMYPAGSGPRSIATSDLNGDGAEDLAVANNDSNDVSILLGQGDGTFLAQQRFTAGSDPRSVAISDLNGDAFPDLAIANFSSDDVSILLGQGDGTFFPQQRFSAGTRPISVAISDLNGDGAEDLSVANNGSDDISILLGRGDGAFFAQQNFSAGTRPMSVATSNLNGDLIPDLAVANNGSDDISIFLGLGDGTFAVQQRYSAAGGPSSIAVSDLNSDGANDLAVANGRSDDVSILLGQGDGTFDSQQRFPAGIAPRSVAISDLNGDGTGDLVVANNDIHSDDDLSIRFGRGDGTFSAQQRISAGVDLWSVAIADFNGDGGGDLAIADDRSDDVSILLGQGDGTFFTQQRFSAARTPWSIAISDLNSDGAKDLAVTSISSDCISIFLGQGDGTFFAEQCYSAGLQPWSVAISDFNGDGFEDLAVANERSHDVSILLGQGNGSFLAQQRFSAGASPRSVAVADLNGDGAQDLAVANEGSHDVSVLLGQGDGTFASQQRFSSGAHPWSVAISDFNGDRAGDLVLANWGSNDVSILLGRGDGSFLAQQRFSAGTRPVSVAISDFNGDGAEDVAASSAGSDAVSILLGLGDGTLLAPQSYYAGAAPTSVAISDLDGDGIPDLAVANNDVSVLLGHGDGTFFPEQRFSAGAGARSLAISDLNGDGSPDLAVADSGFISVRVLLRR